VLARRNDGQKIFLYQSDYQAFVEALWTVPFSLYAYVLMPNHFPAKQQGQVLQSHIVTAQE
jgi:hypothetical protein